MKKPLDFSLIDELTKRTTEEVNKIDPLNILVVGKTGVGKSTLINHLFRERLVETGVGKPITQHLRRISKDGVPMTLFDTRGLELDASVQKQVAEEIKEAIENLKQNNESLDVIYYCLSASSSRIEEMEIDFIQSLAKQAPVIIVLTQSIGQPAKEFKMYIETLNLPIYSVVNVMAKNYKISEDIQIDAFGLDDLLDQSFAVLPENRHEAFNNAQQVDIERKVQAAKSWAKKYMVTTFGVGFTPIPFADATVLVPMQLGMLAHITAIFGISLDKSTLIGIIGAIGGTGGATYLGRTLVSNVMKFLPGVGTAAGGAISGLTAAMVTSALAMSYIEVLAIIATQEAEGGELYSKAVKRIMKERFDMRLKRGKDDEDVKQIVAKSDELSFDDEKPKRRKWQPLKKFVKRNRRK